jgi:hypothetical protein
MLAERGHLLQSKQEREIRYNKEHLSRDAVQIHADRPGMIQSLLLTPLSNGLTGTYLAKARLVSDTAPFKWWIS